MTVESPGGWRESHAQSELHAVHAEALGREARMSEARAAYALAAWHEHEALQRVPADKSRTRGILAVSAASLWYKAGELQNADSVAREHLDVPELPMFAQEALRQFLLSGNPLADEASAQ